MRTIRALAIGLAAAGTAAAPAQAGGYRVDSVRTLSAPAAVPDACTTNHEQEGEAFLASAPRDPRHLVATWGAADGRAAITGVSRNSGNSWSTGAVEGMTACTGGSRPWYIDGWVDIDGGGGAHFAAFASAEMPSPFDIDVLAAGSPDGGAGWTRATLVDAGRAGTNGIISRTSVTADPAGKGRAWAVWSRLLTNPAVDGVYVARTDDGGRTWGPPVAVARPSQPGQLLAAWQMVVLADGTLLAAFGAFESQLDGARAGFFRHDVPVAVQVSASKDGGTTWSPAVTVRRLPAYVLGRLAAAPDGSAWFAWAEVADTARVRLVRTRDGGAGWSEAVDVAAFEPGGMGAADLQPAVAVARSGAVGVSWYQGPRATATRRLAVSVSAGGAWQELTLDHSFAFDTGGGNGDGPVGAYQGLAALGNHGFASLHVVGTGDGPANPTDVRFTRVLRD